MNIDKISDFTDYTMINGIRHGARKFLDFKRYAHDKWGKRIGIMKFTWSDNKEIHHIDYHL